MSAIDSTAIVGFVLYEFVDNLTVGALLDVDGDDVTTHGVAGRVYFGR